MPISAERAAREVREAILDGRYEPGQKLNEADVAESLGMSRTPVREALRRLAAEGLVSLPANRGARVSEYSSAELDRIFVLRAHIEGVAARAAAERAGPDDVAELARLAQAIADEARSGPEPDLRSIYRLNRDFHSILVELASTASLSQIVQALVHTSILMRTYRAFDARAMERSVCHHLELVDAIGAGDPDWAESVMRSHLLSARSALLGAKNISTRSQEGRR